MASRAASEGGLLDLATLASQKGLKQRGADVFCRFLVGVGLAENQVLATPKPWFLGVFSFFSRVCFLGFSVGFCFGWFSVDFLSDDAFLAFFTFFGLTLSIRAFRWDYVLLSWLSCLLAGCLF